MSEDNVQPLHNQTLSFLSEEQSLILTEALATGCGEDGFTEAQLERLLDWAEQTIVDGALLSSILSKEVTVKFEAGESAFTWALTEAGKARAEETLASSAEVRNFVKSIETSARQD